MLFILYLFKTFLSLVEVIYFVCNKDSQAPLILKALTKLLHLILVSHKLLLRFTLGRDLNSDELSRGGSILFVSVVTPLPYRRSAKKMFDIAGNIFPKEFIVDDDMFEIFGGGTRKSTTFRGRVVEKGRIRANISWFAYRNSRYTIIKKKKQLNQITPCPADLGSEGNYD